MKIESTKIDKLLVFVFAMFVTIRIINPPWAYFHPQTGNFVESAGNRFIFDNQETRMQIHYSQLLYDLFAIGLVLFLIAIVIRAMRNISLKIK